MNREISCCIVGAGAPNIATNCQLPASLLCPGLRVAALCDVNPAVRDYAESCGAEAFTDFDAMLKNEAIELVQIASPDPFHTPQALRALAAGKFVLLQKPPCTTRAELDLLLDADRRHPGKLRILLNNRETVLVRTLHEAIQRGRIGEVRAVRLQFRGRRFPVANLQSFYLTAASGGVWMHNGLHWLDEIALLAGDLPARAVHCVAARNDHGKPEFLGEGDNFHAALFDFGRVSGFFEYNTMLLADGLPGGIRRSIIGTEGELRLEFGDTQPTLYRAGAENPEPIPLAAAEFCPENPIVDSFVRAIRNVVREILDGAAPRTDPALALTGMLLSARESVTQGMI